MDNRLSDIEQREEDFLFGREQEIQSYIEFLTGQSPPKQLIWSLYGTGGMGKTTLLDAFRRISYRNGAFFAAIDSREFVHTPEDFCLSLFRQLDDSTNATDHHFDAPEGAKRCLQRISEWAENGPVTLALDTYDEMNDLDGWLREHLLQWLPSNVLTIVVSRKPLGGGWVLSPAWRERVKPIRLSGLNMEQAKAYLARCGVTDIDNQTMIWEKTRGHPLALSLAAASNWLHHAAAAEDGEEWWPLLVEMWLSEVADQHLREWIEVASVLRYFDSEALSAVNGGSKITVAEFDRLCGFSFVRKTPKGWTLHDVMREAASRVMMERTPDRYKKLVASCAHLYMNRILQSPRDGSAVWEIRECFYYIGDASIRWIVSPAENERYVWEPLSNHNLPEGERYLQWRSDQAQSPAATGQLTTLDIVKMKDVSLQEMMRTDHRFVKLLRNQEGDIVGLSVIYPVNAATIPYLEKEPLAAEYIRSLSAEAYEDLMDPANRQVSWFIRIIDVAEPANPLMSIKALELIFSMMVSNGFIITSPPPDPIMFDSHRSLGFQEIEGVYHTYYDGKTATPIFILDTRGDKLRHLFEGHLQQTGHSLPPGSETNKLDELMNNLTEREQEVVKLVIEGLSNADIAKTLYVAEITVKKHLRSVYQKLQVRNRADLLRILL
ncbi:helix-turn-helix domain-containing protein [Paenibacillus beijingensis]|uniref:HTH luxR-type domain-containing protein n=1 Tax=Paenibacillus beijingensis TaxID=1126833 RepID=A0A0D5NI96_9BACL|nr:helix-turn-helix transcriptional regulator [Paenibacillus beijingensis]AJY74840.1 hypothetical protein VN24_09865 [Paenibacillus beijingensis]